MYGIVEERVAAGAEWLDANEPGWERRVDLASLELHNACRCVLGQVFNDRAEAVQQGDNPQCVETGWDYALDIVRMPSTAPLGFSIFSGGQGAAEQWAALDEAWISLIKERFASGLLSDES